MLRLLVAWLLHNLRATDGEVGGAWENLSGVLRSIEALYVTTYKIYLCFITFMQPKLLIFVGHKFCALLTDRVSNCKIHTQHCIFGWSYALHK